MDRVLAEVLALSRWLKVNAQETLGPLAPLLTYAGYVVAAAILLRLLVTGRGFWSPPTPELKTYPARVAGAIIAVCAVGLFGVASRHPNSDMLPLAAMLVAAGTVGAVIYLFLRLALCFKCDFDPTQHVKGLWLTPNARKRMKGKKTGHSLYDVGGPPPANTRVYYCGSQQDPYFVWGQTSQAAAQVLLFVVYLVFIVPTTVGVASASMALLQLDIRETPRETQIDLPSDVLFDFGSAELRPKAVAVLERTEEFLRTRGVTAARVQGHTDLKGPADVNLKLSLARAEAVRAWLRSRDSLKGVAFAVEGLGASQPLEPNANADGSDNPEGRQRNRRVTLVIDKNASR